MKVGGCYDDDCYQQCSTSTTTTSSSKTHDNSKYNNKVDGMNLGLLVSSSSSSSSSSTYSSLLLSLSRKWAVIAIAIVGIVSLTNILCNVKVTNNYSYGNQLLHQVLVDDNESLEKQDKEKEESHQQLSLKNVEQQRNYSLYDVMTFNQKMEEYHKRYEHDIRDWGCDLTTVPFIFIHIGKAGGGSVRARIAASAQNFTVSPGEWRSDYGSYYPIRDPTTGDIVHKARFCNSGHVSASIVSKQKSYEPSMMCHATTPIGMALACPEPLGRKHHDDGMAHDMFSDKVAPIVYVGHNTFGTEYHWLPPRFLEEWWMKHWSPTNTNTTDVENNISNDDKILPRWKSLVPNSTSWCDGSPRPEKNIRQVEICQEHLHKDIDIQARDLVLSKFRQTYDNDQHHNKNSTLGPLLLEDGTTNTANVIEDEDGKWYTTKHHENYLDENYYDTPIWGAVHASLPVLRATQLREPFSWFLSKFYWTKLYKNHTCDDIDDMIVGDADNVSSNDNNNINEPTIQHSGWMTKNAMTYLLQLCGEDCKVRYHNNQTNLEDLEKQVAYNLRHSMAVVGLSNETQTFFDMLQARVDYFNTTLNLHVTGKRHESTSYKTEEQQRCRTMFLENQDFQTKVKNLSPEVAALCRLYQVGLNVNRQQLKELQQCSPSSFTQH